jgi:hypothetical protein
MFALMIAAAVVAATGQPINKPLYEGAYIGSPGWLKDPNSAKYAIHPPPAPVVAEAAMACPGVVVVNKVTGVRLCRSAPVVAETHPCGRPEENLICPGPPPPPPMIHWEAVPLGAPLPDDHGECRKLGPTLIECRVISWQNPLWDAYFRYGGFHP